MGSSATKPVPLAPAFQRMSTWEFKSAKRLLSDYKDKDLDFGLDAQGLSELVHGDKTWASEIIDAFGSTNGMGFCVLSGIGTVPSDEDLEAITLQAYRELNKSSGQSISKSEFTKWALWFAAGSTGGATTMTAMHADVSLDDALEQFGILTVLSRGNAPHVGGDLASEITSSIDVNNNEDTSHNKDRTDVQGLVGEAEAPDEAEHRSYEEDAEPEENNVAHAQVKPATPQPDEQQDKTFERANEMAVQQDVCHQKEAELYEAQPSSANEYAEQDEEQEYEQEFAAETPRSARVEEGGEPSLDSNAFQDRRGTEDDEPFEAEAMNRDQDSPPQDDADLLASERDEPSEVTGVGEGMTTSVSPPLEPEVQGLDATASYGVDTEEPAADASQPEEQESVGSTQREEQQLVDTSQVKVSDAVDISQPEVPSLEGASQLEEAAPGPHATPDSPITPEGLEGSERETGKDEVR
uniref:Uncharacterized protein n=1 Tax=Globisporangium ultimum (strain ATCC 200006 / CBS 805.95 / DAOM BR144) TaxID=431595 RepID=K3WMI8_GLOUD